MIRKGGGEAKKRKKPRKSDKRNVGNGADLVEDENIETTNKYPAATAARPDAPARPSYHVERKDLGTGGDGQDWGGRRRGEEEQETPEELNVMLEIR